MRIKLKEGDIFSIELDDKHVGFGQILIKKGTLFIIVFAESYDKNHIPELKEIIKPIPLLMGETMDALLYDGDDWKIVGSSIENLNQYPLPYYKVGLPTEIIYVVNHLGERLRPATSEEIKTLNYQASYAPIRFENALKAYHKLIPWDKSYDAILYKEVLRKSIVALNSKN
ncbi:immunity protein 26 of polymorphic toxin system [Lacibacter cauensis]|uniref:Immunity protein 26 of polymorphic toxin system n=1 Tax=Lacibacter cauensis TaxID=510947 RepID=A0A562SRQ5_9BACT|nr:Imm26 family immunity protein [Lacibacter cauensis]TWI83949.1 immunity protein 26 of polymorphic toxin system [Lacibacter cauensis]